MRQHYNGHAFVQKIEDNIYFSNVYTYNTEQGNIHIHKLPQHILTWISEELVFYLIINYIIIISVLQLVYWLHCKFEIKC